MKLISSKTEYEVKGEIVKAPNHYGTHHNPKSTTYHFEPGEFIVGIDGRYGNIMVCAPCMQLIQQDTVTIITTHRTIRTGSSNGGRPFSIRLPSGCVAISLTGGVGGHIHNIGLDYVALEWSPQHFKLLSANDKKIVKVTHARTAADLIRPCCSATND